ncbi:MAG TPA: site-2 protease family protein [Polyangiaceae bacterium]|jgi:Zn-dependent protease|nr:site-2 protease family protein [Polyangiaceae bacterium]
MTTDLVAPSALCADCRAPLPLNALSCPACGALVHRNELAALSASARAHAERGESSEERAALEKMLALLPDIAPQGRQLRLRLSELKAAAPAATAEGGTASPPGGKARGPLTLLGALSLALWKFKSLGLLLLGKGKLLLIGLTKAKTVFSMLIALGAYWTIWGWQFALGFVLSIYVHEMGHVIALRRLGIPASAPMFIPFVGAFVRLNRGPDTVHDDAIAGLAGPIYGLGAALFCYAVYKLTSISLFGALARSGAWLNLFNLIPVWQLDGGRAFNALDKTQRWLTVAVIGATWFWFHESMLLLLLLGALYRTFMTPAPTSPDRRAAWSYGLLVVVLAATTHLHLPEIANHEAFGP